MGFWCCVGDWLAVLQGMTPTQAAYFSACLVSAMSFIGVLTIGLLQIESIKGPVEYLSLCFAGTALAADALMHLLPEAYGVHSHDGEQAGGHHDHGHDHSSSASSDEFGPMFFGLMAAVGALSLLLLDTLVGHSHPSGQEHDHEPHLGFEEESSPSARTMKMKSSTSGASTNGATASSPKSVTGADTSAGSRSGSPRSPRRVETSKRSRSRPGPSAGGGGKTVETASSSPSIKSFGLANLAVELVHNFVDGIAIGIAWTSSKNSVSAGLNTTIAVIVHEIPQELGDFMVLRLAGFPVRRLLFVNFLVSLSTILGVFCSTYLISSEQTTATVKKTLMALTAGSFLSLSLYLIFPQVKESIETHHKEKGKRKKPFLACFLTSLIALWMVYQVGVMEESVGHGGGVVGGLVGGIKELVDHDHHGHSHEGGHHLHHHDHHHHHDDLVHGAHAAAHAHAAAGTHREHGHDDQKVASSTGATDAGRQRRDIYAEL